MKRSTLVVCSSVGALVAAGGLALLLESSPGTAARPLETPTASPAIAAALDPSAPDVGPVGPCRFEQGDQLAYGLSLESRTTQLAPGGETMADTRLTLSGRLELEVASADAREAVLFARLSRLSLSSAGLSERELSNPFLVKIDATCRLTAFARHVATPRSVGRNQQSLLWDTQFQTSATHEFRMENGNGVAVGTIERTGADTVRRSLSSYTSLWGERREGRATEGVMVVLLSEGGWFQTLDLAETFSSADARLDVRMSLSGGAPEGVQLDAGERELSAYVWENLLPSRRKDLVSRPVTSFDVKRREKVASLTVTEAVDQFADRHQRGVGIQDTWPELSAYFETHPEAIEPAVRRYLDGELPPRAAGDFFLALGKARVPEAREKLLALKRDNNAETMDRVRSMFALALREDVGVALATEFARDANRELSLRSQEGDFLGGETLLALSMMSGAREDVEVARVARGAVSDALAGTPRNLQVARAALGSIGNLGEASMLAAARPFIAAPDPKLRRAATKAFTRMPSPESTQIALEWLGRERDALVKRDLYDVLQRQHFDAGQGAGRALTMQAIADLPTMKTPYSRRALVRLIAQSEISQEPEVRQALIRQARYEREKGTDLLNEFQHHLTQQEIGEVLR